MMQGCAWQPACATPCVVFVTPVSPLQVSAVPCSFVPAMHQLVPYGVAQPACCPATNVAPVQPVAIATMGAAPGNSTSTYATQVEAGSTKPTSSALRRRRRQRAAEARAVEQQALLAESEYPPEDANCEKVRTGKSSSDVSTSDECDNVDEARSVSSGEGGVPCIGVSSMETVHGSEQTSSQVEELDICLCDFEGLDLDSDAESRAQALHALSSRFREFSFHPHGCRLVQQAIAVADRKQLTSILLELHGTVLAAIESPHANYVMQKVIEQAPLALSSFVVHEMVGNCVSLACHKFGCRILCRIFEHNVHGVDQVADEVLAAATRMFRHPFGHFVIEAMLEHGSSAHRAAVVRACRGDILRLSRHRCGTRIVERALLYGDAQDQFAIASELLGPEIDNATVCSLATQQYAANVLLTLATLQSDAVCIHRQALMFQLEVSAMSIATENKHGARLLRDLGFQKNKA